ncbi:DUF3047 domain-containing protein [Sinimarinibacterium sp. NLF-5-8]|uniref:DUF3047 domain-containing protein n=1 Tax=Sinimarinibacterium sp. NLF-5-8 TaxID=2698684 RepID=UPI00137BDB89|nr:DUF3047 domain-containing protein [Sinimarinibacterium sp. NLF-5-8]QHS09752.1 DUF3047 domain-containing protein [Sinimarinibacterium sp. NLF-5-8]
MRHRLTGGGHVPHPDFQSRIEHALQSLGDAVQSCTWLDLRATPTPWQDTGISVAAGQAVTLIADGMIYASRALDIGFEARTGLWYRIDDAPMAKIVGNACTFYSARAGDLRITTKPPGEFAGRDGQFDPRYPRQRFAGALTVAVILWRCDPIDALQQAAQQEPTLFDAALARLQAPILPPQGWHYLWRLGQGEIFSPSPRHEGGVCCHTQADVGILQFPVDLPLTEETRVDWSWCVEQLPSKLPEHTEPTHDYLSLAVEFDNGLDLTWMWSVSLPTDTVFQCPLPWWDARETHWVVRSGTDQLGQWVNESRSVLADYQKAIGGDLPKRIVGIWLIANTVFQRAQGRCEYRDIQLHNGQRHPVVRVGIP